MKTADQIRKEIEATQENQEALWLDYDNSMKSTAEIMGWYREVTQKLAELRAEEFLILTKERGK